MKSTLIPVLAALAAKQVAAHATFQDLWVNGVDLISLPPFTACVRLPNSNNPVTDVTGASMRCNVGGTTPAKSKCPVKAGDTVSVEMHQQNGDRSCANEAIGGAHYGPLMVYMSKVADAASADGSTGWFKVFQDTWKANPSGSVGDDDFWGTKDMNTCCGRTNVKIPTDIASGDYLLRAEVIALHVAGQPMGAQLYMSCYQITVAGGGSATPATVLFPGAYSANDPGILIDIHSKVSNYVAPGPAVYSGGSTKVAGSPCVGCESTCTPGSAPATSLPASTPTSAPPSSPPGSPPSSPPSGGCTSVVYAQCGGEGFTGCTTCASGLKCVAVSPPYYSQCQTA